MDVLLKVVYQTHEAFLWRYSKSQSGFDRHEELTSMNC